jgi:hypothetical protein
LRKGYKWQSLGAAITQLLSLWRPHSSHPFI